MPENRSEAILQTLRKTFPTLWQVAFGRKPFETLIATIISQNTIDKNASKVFQNLLRNFEIAPEALLEAKVDQIE